MRALLLFAALFTGTLSAGNYRVWGRSKQDSHFLSVTELIGRPDTFNGQPVAVVGVAQFQKDNGPVFRLYANREDLDNSIPAAVKIGSFSKSLKITENEMESLNGKVVLIEGTFQMYQRPKLTPGKLTTICLDDCGVPGVIQDIVVVTTWPPR